MALRDKNKKRREASEPRTCQFLQHLSFQSTPSFFPAIRKNWIRGKSFPRLVQLLRTHSLDKAEVSADLLQSQDAETLQVFLGRYLRNTGPRQSSNVSGHPLPMPHSVKGLITCRLTGFARPRSASQSASAQHLSQNRETHDVHTGRQQGFYLLRALENVLFERGSLQRRGCITIRNVSTTDRIAQRANRQTGA